MDGIIGLGESYGAKALLDALALLNSNLIGMDVTNIHELWKQTHAVVHGAMEGYTGKDSLLPRVVGAVEVALWDAFGKTTDRSVCDLLGGQVWDDIPFQLTYFTNSRPTRDRVRAIKLKAGILPPEDEIAGAAAMPNLTFGCDTHSPWQTDKVIEGGKLQFTNGALKVPDGPSLGVTLDRSELARLHKNYLECRYETRDDETELQKHWHDWKFARPKF